jgi:hypothetical protein
MEERYYSHFAAGTLAGIPCPVDYAYGTFCLDDFENRHDIRDRTAGRGGKRARYFDFDENLDSEKIDDARSHPYSHDQDRRSSARRLDPYQERLDRV